MSTLSLRTVGMSYLIEGLEPSALDLDLLLANLVEIHGLAVAPMSAPSSSGLVADRDASSIDALIVDRRAVPWDGLRDWLEAWVSRQGCSYVSWADDGRDQTASTLHFHR